MYPFDSQSTHYAVGGRAAAVGVCLPSIMRGRRRIRPAIHVRAASSSTSSKSGRKSRVRGK